MRNALGVMVAVAIVADSTVLGAQVADTGTVRTAPGVGIYYEKYGNGPSVVLVPGRLFMPEWRQLRRPDRTLVMYDMRNRGKSGRVEDTTRITIEGDVEDVEALRQHFGANRISLVGYSYLGLMVAWYATKHPDRVDRIVQIGPVPRAFGTPYPDDQTSGTATLSAEGRAAAQAWQAASRAPERADNAELCRIQHRFLSYWLVGNPANHARVPDACVYENERFDSQQRHMRAHFGDIQKRSFAKEPFTRLAQPVLTVHGTLDRNASYGAGLEWATTFRDGRLITVAGGAHQVWLDDPAVLADVDAFLAGRWPARAQAFGRN